jgi:hypothetical protein
MVTDGHGLFLLPLIKSTLNCTPYKQFGGPEFLEHPHRRAWLEPTHLGAQGSHHQHEGASNGLGSKGHFKVIRAGTLEAWHKEVVKVQA